MLLLPEASVVGIEKGAYGRKEIYKIPFSAGPKMLSCAVVMGEFLALLNIRDTQLKHTTICTL